MSSGPRGPAVHPAPLPLSLVIPGLTKPERQTCPAVQRLEDEADLEARERSDTQIRAGCFSRLKEGANMTFVCAVEMSFSTQLLAGKDPEITAGI